MRNTEQNVTTIAKNIGQLRSRLRQLEQRYQRPAESVKLLAVSKRHSVQKIIDANQTGVQDFAENYLQEALEKIQQLQELRLNWHFIGPIQANKTKPIAENFQWVHSIERRKIAQRLSDQRGADAPALNVCVQVKLSDETTKSGVALNKAEALCEIIDGLPNLQLRGLMAIPPVLHDVKSQREIFRQLADEFIRLKERYSQLDTLSMGMSDDYEAAIAEGSTVIRIGTAIFGERS